MGKREIKLRFFMTKYKNVFQVLVAIFLFVGLSASGFDIDSRLPIDERLIIGTLENGLTYYIMQNAEPPSIAEFRLSLKVGANHEDDDQLGVAHFVEHLAFCGSAHFPADSLNTYMDSIGFGFLSYAFNAATSDDHTEYMLRSRTDDVEQLDTAVLILSEWAARLTLDDDMVEKERGIILEEMRGGRGAAERTMMRTFNMLYEGSRYGTRMPIGTQEVIQNVDADRIRDFYNDWYRPDLMAVIAVGDFDPEDIRALIYKHFEEMPFRENPRPVPDFSVQEHSETRFSFGSDMEAEESEVTIYHKFPRFPLETIRDYKDNHVLNMLLSYMLYNRYEKISRQPDSPFISSYGWVNRTMPPVGLSILDASVFDDKIVEGFTELITEFERIRQHGFHESEFERAKAEWLSFQQSYYLESDNLSSSQIAESLSMNFVWDNVPLGDKNEYYITKYLLETIELNDIMDILDSRFTEENRVVIITTTEEFGVQNSELRTPNSSQGVQKDTFLSLFEAVKELELEMYPETVLEEPFMSRVPRRVRVRRPRYISLPTEEFGIRNSEFGIPKSELRTPNSSWWGRWGIYKWELKNGATIYLMPTDIKNNEILFEVFRKGGLSQADDEIFHSAYFADEIISDSGLGVYDSTQLDFYLAGKDVDFNLLLNQRYENVYGGSSTNDIETLFQMIWQTFNNPRFDEIAFTTWKQRKEITVRNQTNNPDIIFRDAYLSLLYNDHLRYRRITSDDIAEISHLDAFDFFRSRFDSVQDFNFIFVGNINPKDLQWFIERYIATLPRHPSQAERSSAQGMGEIIDRGIRLNQEPASREIYHGQDDRTIVRLLFTNDRPHFSIEDRYIAEAMSSILSLMLWENVRERLNGVYYIDSWFTIEAIPTPQIALNIALECDPHRVDELIDEIYVQLNHLLNNTFEDRFFNIYRDTARQSLETDSRNNEWWLYKLMDCLLYDWDFGDIMTLPYLLESGTREDIVDFARKYLDLEKSLRIVLLPPN